MSPTPPAREFIVVHVATVLPVDSTRTSEASTPKALGRLVSPAIIVLAALLYLVVVVGYVAMTGVSLSSASEPWVWLLCLPYAALMTQKLLKTIRVMEESEESEATSMDGRTEDRDALTVVGDVCIYVVGILLFCFFVLPWRVHVD